MKYLHKNQTVSNQIVSSSILIKVVPLLAGGVYNGGPSYHGQTGRYPDADKLLLTNVSV